MLRFWLGRDAVDRDWTWDGSRWSSGQSWVEPCHADALASCLWTDGARVAVAVWERAAGAEQHPVPPSAQTAALTSAVVLQERIDAVLRWPLEFIVVDLRPGGEVRVSAGAWGTAPVYVCECAGALRGSWSLPEVTSGASAERLDPLEVTRSLTLRDRYACSTVFSGVLQVTERATAVWNGRGLEVLYPDDAMHALPRSLRDGVDIIDAYEQRLRQAVARRVVTPERAAVELSAGMDSSSVAVALAELFPGQVRSYALTYDGPAGAQQRRRRRELIEALALQRDLVVRASELLPFTPFGRRGRGEVVSPHEEPYDEAFGGLIQHAAQDGVRTAFTGDGGDELVGLRGHEWDELGKIPGRNSPAYNFPPWLGPRARAHLDAVDDGLAPAARVHESTLLGFACRSPLFLRAGVWPVSPLADPDLIRFGEQLPLDWRDGKRLVRAMLTRKGFSDELVHPPLRENFASLMPRALQRYGIQLWQRCYRADSMLVDLGFVDADAVQQAVARFQRGVWEQTDPLLYQVLALEIGLRGMVLPAEHAG